MSAFELSAEDREALGDWWDSDWPDSKGGALGTLAAAVEAITQAAINAALNDAADAIENERRSLDKAGHISFATGCFRAERIVRARTH